MAVALVGPRVRALLAGASETCRAKRRQFLGAIATASQADNLASSIEDRIVDAVLIVAAVPASWRAKPQGIAAMLLTRAGRTARSSDATTIDARLIASASLLPGAFAATAIRGAAILAVALGLTLAVDAGVIDARFPGRAGGAGSAAPVAFAADLADAVLGARLGLLLFLLFLLGFGIIPAEQRGQRCPTRDAQQRTP
jgi:hypothetical protein